MAADKKIMAEIETLRLDRPGRVYRAMVDAVATGGGEGAQLLDALRELAATYREEAELWSRSGAKGWKGSEAEKYLVAQHIDDVAAQLDNVGGGAALSVSAPTFPDNGCTHGADCNIHPEVNAVHNFDDAGDAALEAELRESAKRVDSVRDVAGLDALIADSVAARKGHVPDDLLPEGHPARSDTVERKTAYDWNTDPRIDPIVVSWSDFGSSAHRLGMTFGKDDLIAQADFEKARDGGAVTVRRRTVEYKPDGTLLVDGMIVDSAGSVVGIDRTFPGQVSADEVTAYLKGETNDIPGTPPLSPSSVTSAPESDNPFAPTTLQLGHVELTDNGDGTMSNREPISVTVDTAAGARTLAPGDTLTVPQTWESETMTADGHRTPGAPTGAPLLGQPGNASAGYSHSYVPAGGRAVTYAELLTPVPAASLPAHLSHSQGNTVGDCGVKYRFQRVEQLPQVPQWANIGGTAFHAAVEAIEVMMAGKPGLSLDGYDVEKSWKIWFEAEIGKIAASSPVPISMWRAARKGAEGRAWWEVNGPLMLRRYLDARPQRRPITIDSTGTPAIEWEITADVPTGYGPVPFVAKIDSVKLSEDGSAIVIEDYKTSYERPTDTTQLGEYAHALMLSGANLHGATRILGTYFDARRGEWTTPVDLLAEHPFEAFQYRVTTAHAQKMALTTGPTPARPSSYCGGCSVRYACPVMALKS